MPPVLAPSRHTRVRRRSKRLRLTVPVEIVASQDGSELFRESAQVQCVSAHGGLVVMAGAVSVGQILRIINRNTREHQDCRVVNVESAEGSKWAAGIEFLEPAGNFWQISFPAISARPGEEACN